MAACFCEAEAWRFRDKFCAKCDLRGTKVPVRSHFVTESEELSLRVKLIPVLQGEEAGDSSISLFTKCDLRGTKCA